VEIFGPAISVLTYRDEDHAVEIANDTTYGLSIERAALHRGSRRDEWVSMAP
jgi:acyl-CoA reductase-like NAD-dependent aldehyde dehydrogenase